MKLLLLVVCTLVLIASLLRSFTFCEPMFEWYIFCWKSSVKPCSVHEGKLIGCIRVEDELSSARTFEYEPLVSSFYIAWAIISSILLTQRNNASNKCFCATYNDESMLFSGINSKLFLSMLYQGWCAFLCSCSLSLVLVSLCFSLHGTAWIDVGRSCSGMRLLRFDEQSEQVLSLTNKMWGVRFYNSFAVANLRLMCFECRTWNGLSTWKKLAVGSGSS